MQTVTLGRTGITVNKNGFGALPIQRVDVYKRQAQVPPLLGGAVLVLGNHDLHRSPQQWRDLGFEEAVPWPILWEGFFLLSHQPLYVNVNMPYANVYGHVHGSPTYRDASSHSVCVSAERTGFAPLSQEELRARIQESR